MKNSNVGATHTGAFREWTEDFDQATGKKYWYHPASASSVYEEPESLAAAVTDSQK